MAAWHRAQRSGSTYLAPSRGKARSAANQAADFMSSISNVSRSPVEFAGCHNTMQDRRNISPISESPVFHRTTRSRVRSLAHSPVFRFAQEITSSPTRRAAESHLDQGVWLSFLWRGLQPATDLIGLSLLWLYHLY